jgi:hypothetical protein
MGATDTIVYHGFSRSNLRYNLISQTNGGEEPVPPPTPPTTTTTTTPTTSTKPVLPTTGHPTPGFVDIPIPSILYFASYLVENDTITVAVFATTTGYVGFGFTNDTGMVNSDMMIGGVNEDGSFYFGVSLTDTFMSFDNFKKKHLTKTESL